MYKGDDFASFDCGTEMREVGRVAGEDFTAWKLYQCPSCKTIELQ